MVNRMKTLANVFPSVAKEHCFFSFVCFPMGWIWEEEEEEEEKEGVI